MAARILNAGMVEIMWKQLKPKKGEESIVLWFKLV